MNRKGLTLLELMIVLGVSSIMMVVIVSIVVSISNNRESQENRITQLSDTRMISDLIKTKVRHSNQDLEVINQSSDCILLLERNSQGGKYNIARYCSDGHGLISIGTSEFQTNIIVLEIEIESSWLLIKMVNNKGDVHEETIRLRK